MIGTVITRRVKGEYGVIEIVLAIRVDGRVRGVRLQRLREPKVIADALRSPQWLEAFEGKTFESRWQLGKDVPTEARSSAQAVIEGVRSLLILLETAEQRRAPAAPVTHH